VPDLERLSNVPLFASLTPDELAKLRDWTETRTHAAGERITPQGASAYSFFVIEEGTADVVQDGTTIGTLGPGDHFGEIAILDGGRRTADVVATTDLRLAVMFGQTFRQLEAEMPSIAARIRATMEERLGRS
jgi:CRP/FNR family transcriptional regulator, cyclic AMP receptor protein